eukprot:CAMPEP_0116878466 /NCGR_PEP_ID=MMETSP0463-20121206/10221_1 /TAXON_ID=181622 /ORGANISM="Strombidinopsis sp, Strain SopsisLIS2011" /LENGTH=81 /DNA_ID=CAMNT_0004526725 /DNA_START=1237 /DNA_END=1482 /DNA_ORIENTATION=-
MADIDISESGAVAVTVKNVNHEAQSDESDETYVKKIDSGGDTISMSMASCSDYSVTGSVLKSTGTKVFKDTTKNNSARLQS